jgi:biotin carboxyl carrier protein
MVLSFWGRLFVWVAAISGGLLIVALVALIIRFAQEEPGAPAAGGVPAAEQTQHPAEVSVVRLVPQTHFEQTLEFPGRLVAKRETRLGFELGGALLEPLAEMGQSVTTGQELAALDTQLLVKNHEQLKFQIERAHAVLGELEAGPRATTILAAAAEVEALKGETDNAARLVRRLSDLAERAAVSEQELDNARATEQALFQRQTAAEQRLAELRAGTRPEQLAAQRALVQSLLSDAELTQLRIAKSILRAPFSGVIVKQYAAAGQVLAPGEPVFDLVQTDTLEAHVGVSAEVAATLNVGQAYPLLAEQEQIMATLLRIVPVVDAQTQTVMVIFGIDADPLLAAVSVPGRLVRLRWVLEVPEPGYWLPNDALVRGRRGLWAVCELEDVSRMGTNEAAHSADSAKASVDGMDEPSPRTTWTARVRQQQVELLHSTNERSYVRGTLQSGAWVVGQGAHRLLDGQLVQVSPPESTVATGTDRAAVEGR